MKNFVRITYRTKKNKNSVTGSHRYVAYNGQDYFAHKTLRDAIMWHGDSTLIISKAATQADYDAFYAE